VPETVIVPLDGSELAERALAPAAELARRAQARVVVLTARYGGVVVEPRHYLEEAARTAGIADPEPVVVEGRLAASSIVDLVGASPDPVVCMATHARGGAGQALFGSVAEEVLRRADAPILLVGPSVPAGPQHFEELVVGLDGSALATAMLPVAAAWTRDLGLSLTLVTAEPESHAAGGAILERAVQLEPECSDARQEVLGGRGPADAIVEFASGRPGVVLALTTHGRTGLARLTAGSVMMAVVRRAPCPVLTLRPAGLD
jgi:nucleotide-binding universal stress UspA family protein